MLKYFILFCLLPFVSFSQTQSDKRFTKALKLYHQGEYEQCIAISQKIVNKDKHFENAYLLISDCYSALQNIQQQTNILLSLIKTHPNPRPQVLKQLALLYYKNKQFDTSVYYINQYLQQEKKTAQRSKAIRLKSKLETALKLYNDSLPITFKSVPSTWKTPGDSYFIRISADDSLAIFTVRYSSGRYLQEDFFQSKKENDSWSEAEPIKGELNTPQNEGAHCLSPDGRWLFFTACGRKDGYGRCDIYFSQKKDGKWSRPVNLGRPVNTAAWESQPALSADGKALYFVSNRSGTIGGKDIWKAKIKSIDQQGKPILGQPVNLGPQINSASDEMSPFIHFDNQHLYFASSGHNTMGGLDIFVSKKQNGQWQAPENIGYPINSINDDSGFFVSANAKNGWLTSNRNNEKLALFNFNLPEQVAPSPTIFVKGSVRDKYANPLFARILITQLENTNTDTIISNNNGHFLASLPVNKKYAVTVQKNGYLFYSQHFQLQDSINKEEGYWLDITLEPIQVGKKAILNNIFFASNSAELTVESDNELNQLLLLMQQNPSIKIEISGHTDNTGTKQFNQVLSEKRALAVVQFLVEKGISKKRLSYKGYGSSQPIVKNNSKQNRQQNRRTEIKIIANN